MSTASGALDCDVVVHGPLSDRHYLAPSLRVALRQRLLCLSQAPLM